MSSWPNSSPYREPEPSPEPMRWTDWLFILAAASPLIAALIVGGAAWIVAAVFYGVLFLMGMVLIAALTQEGF